MSATEIEVLARHKLAGHGPLRLLLRGEIRRASELLRPGERPVALAPGTRGRSTALLVATDQRIFVVESEGDLAVPFEELTSLGVDDTVRGDAADLAFTVSGRTHTFRVRPQLLAAELAAAAAPGPGAGRSTIVGQVGGRLPVDSRGSPRRWVVRVVLWIVAGVVSFAVFGGIGDDGSSDGRLPPDARPAAGRCLDVDGRVVSCEEIGALWRLVSRPAGAARCSRARDDLARTFPHMVSRAVRERVRKRRLCVLSALTDSK